MNKRACGHLHISFSLSIRMGLNVWPKSTVVHRHNYVILAHTGAKGIPEINIGLAVFMMEFMHNEALKMITTVK